MADPGSGERGDEEDDAPPQPPETDDHDTGTTEPDREQGTQSERAEPSHGHHDEEYNQPPEQDRTPPGPQHSPPHGPPHETQPQHGRPPQQSGPHQQQPPPPGPPPQYGSPPQQGSQQPLQHGDPHSPPQQQFGITPHEQGPPEKRYQTDPVKETYSGQVDLYDIATWEVRTPLDSLAVTVTNGLRASRTVILVAVAAVLFLGQILVAGVLILEEPLLAVLAILSVLPALALAGYFWYGDPTMREPVTLLAATFLLSMLFASFAAVINSTFLPGFEPFGMFGLAVFFFVIVGPIEEFVKWLAIRVYAYQSDTFQTIADGAVYGAVAGLGFAAIENLIYIVSVYIETAPAGGDIQSQFTTSVATQRAFVGPGHVIFSAWAGFYLGLAKFNPSNRGPIVVKGLLIAAFIHALYNTMVTWLPELLSLTVGGLFGIILLYHGFWFALLYRKISRYRQLYQQIGQQRPPQ